MRPKFSIVIPLYNKETYIKRTINSVLSQSFIDFEIVVVDDGSTDKSAELVRSIKDPRIRLISQKNQGVSAARNRGIKESRNPLIAFLDADDEWLPSFLKEITTLIKEFPKAGAFACNYIRCYNQYSRKAHIYQGPIDSDWRGLITPFFKWFLLEMPITSSSVVIKKEVLHQIGDFKTHISDGEDVDLWCRVGLNTPVAFSNKPQVIYHKDVPDSQTALIEKKELPFIQDYKEHIENLRLSKQDHYFLKEYIYSLQINKAFWCFSKGHKTEGWKLLRQSIKTHIFRKNWVTNAFIGLIPSKLYRSFRKRKYSKKRLQ